MKNRRRSWPDLVRMFDQINEYHLDIFLLYAALAWYYVVAYVAATDLPRVLWLGAANVCILIGTHTLSKFFDQREDRVNGQHLGRGVYPYLPYAAAGVFTLGVVGYGLVWPALLPFAAIFIGAGVFYSIPTRWRIKNLLLLKNLVPASIWFTSLQLLAAAGGGLTLAAAMQHNVVALVLFLAFEILWDIPDVAGDRTHGVRTIPTIFGVTAARGVIVVLVALVFLLSSSLMTKVIALVIAGSAAAIPSRTPKRYYHLVLYAIAFVLAYFLMNEAIT